MTQSATPATPAVSELPAEFDHAIYVSHPDNADLHGLDPTEAWHHYDAYGRHEGRPCSAVDTSAAFMALLPSEGMLLEIGPGSRPCLKPGAYSVRMLDVFPTDELRRRAERENGDPAGVPDIDLVWQGEPYRELTRERFDAVIASHSLERQPCLITHLTDVASVLRIGGRFFVILTDRRVSAAHYMSDSTLTDALAAFVSRRTRHSAYSFMADRLMRTHNESGAHWGGRHGADPRGRLPDALLRDEVASAMRAVRTASGYVDVPAWYFTPDSFRHLIDTLASIGLSPFRVERVYRTVRPRIEFYAVLRVAA
ncbi:MAG TPA: hypothetical protein VLI93_03550 [Acetobacteraceae bacterium]|nr:hypothetical protein [Acetobacteraceae bacterium]